MQKQKKKEYQIKYMKFSIPKPPSVNTLYGFHGWHKYMTKRGKEWFEEAGWKIREQVPYTGKPLRESKLTIVAYIIQGDIDNLLKATQDLLTQMEIIEDDRYIMHIDMTKFVVHHRKDERLDIIIEKYANKGENLCTSR